MRTVGSTRRTAFGVQSSEFRVWGIGEAPFFGCDVNTQRLQAGSPRSRVRSSVLTLTTDTDTLNCRTEVYTGNEALWRTRRLPPFTPFPRWSLPELSGFRQNRFPISIRVRLLQEMSLNCQLTPREGGPAFALCFPARVQLTSA
jgi:hypothetical protein